MWKTIGTVAKRLLEVKPMPREQVNQLQNLSIPFRGMNSQLPAVGLPPEYAVYLENLRFANGALEQRQGAVKWAPMQYDTAPVVNSFTQYGAMVNGPGGLMYIYTCRTLVAQTVEVLRLGTTPGVRVTQFIAGAPLNNIPSWGENKPISVVEFAGVNVCFPLGSSPFTDDGTSLAVVTMTGPTLANCWGGAKYNERLYIISASQTVYYSPTVGAITGAFSALDLSNYLDVNDLPTNIFQFSISGQIDSEQFLAIITHTGTTLIFRGIEPGDASWELAAQLKLSRPLGVQTWVAFNGDVALMTQMGVLSFRSLIQQGTENIDQSYMTAPIANMWRDLATSMTEQLGILFSTSDVNYIIQNYGNSVNATFDAKNNRLVIGLPVRLRPLIGDAIGYTIDTDDDSLLAYDISSGSWYFMNTSVMPYSTTPSISPDRTWRGFLPQYQTNTGRLLVAKRAWVEDDTLTNPNWIRDFNSNRYADDDNAEDIFAGVGVDLITGATFNNRQMRSSGVNLLHTGTINQKSNISVGVRGNVAGAFLETQLSLPAGPSSDLYNIGRVDKFIQLRIKKEVAPVGAQESAPYQIGNISLLNQTGGIL